MGNYVRTKYSQEDARNQKQHPHQPHLMTTPYPRPRDHQGDHSSQHTNKQLTAHTQFNHPTIIGLRYSEIRDNTIMVPQITGDSVTRDQVAELLVRNAETFERDSYIEACTRIGCPAPAACYLQRRKEQNEHLLLYHYLKCIQVIQPRRNLLTRNRR